jgi:hypothetical protein
VTLQAVQLLGAFLILGGFVGVQVGRLKVNDVLYMILNICGAALLLIAAVVNRQWGFILLEAAWTTIAAIGLFRYFLGSTYIDRQPRS